MENAGSGTALAPGIAFDGDSDTGIFRPGADQLGIATGGTGRLFIASNGNVGVGTATPAVKLDVSGRARASTGILFGNDTAEANVLDDYEEGTFTPAIVGKTTAGTGAYTFQDGRYTKIGRLVTYVISVLWTSHTGTGDMVIGGLPFTPIGNEYPASCWMDNVSLTSNHVLTAYAATSTTTIELSSYPAGGGAASAITLNTAGYLIISGSYHV